MFEPQGTFSPQHLALKESPHYGPTWSWFMTGLPFWSSAKPPERACASQAALQSRHPGLHPAFPVLAAVAAAQVAMKPEMTAPSHLAVSLSLRRRSQSLCHSCLTHRGEVGRSPEQGQVLSSKSTKAGPASPSFSCTGNPVGPTAPWIPRPGRDLLLSGHLLQFYQQAQKNQALDPRS